MTKPTAGENPARPPAASAALQNPPSARWKGRSGLAWISASILAQTAANVFAKQAALEHRGQGMLALLFNGWNALQLAALAAQALCWMMALRIFPLSFAYPATSLVIGLNLLCAALIFKEAVAWHHLFGIGMIMAGVILVGSRAKA